MGNWSTVVNAAYGIFAHGRQQVDCVQWGMSSVHIPNHTTVLFPLLSD
jgi:hypothetical protein